MRSDRSIGIVHYNGFWRVLIMGIKFGTIILLSDVVGFKTLPYCSNQEFMIYWLSCNSKEWLVKIEILDEYGMIRIIQIEMGTGICTKTQSRVFEERFEVVKSDSVKSNIEKMDYKLLYSNQRPIDCSKPAKMSLTTIIRFGICVLSEYAFRSELLIRRIALIRS